MITIDLPDDAVAAILTEEGWVAVTNKRNILNINLNLNINPKNNNKLISNTRTCANSRSRATAIPEDFLISEDMRAWAIEHTPAVNLANATEQFTDHALATGRKAKNWEAAWRMWMRKAQEWAKPVNPTGYQETNANDFYVKRGRRE